MKALNLKLRRDLQTFRLQIVTMSLLIACGVAVLVASWSAYNSLKSAQDTYYKQYGFADLFADLVRAPETLLSAIHQINGVDAAEGRIVEEVLVDVPGQAEPALGRIISFSPQSLINKIYLRRGRLPERGSTPEVLVHESFANAHRLLPGDTFFISIKGQKKRVQISGIGLTPEYVYALSPLTPFPDDKHFGIFWMHKEALAHLTDLQGAFNNVVVKISENANSKRIQTEMEQILAGFGSLGTYDRSRQISNLFVEDEIRQQRSMTYVVPSIFIVVAIFILHTVLSRLIGLHRTQIAALKSLGYSSRSLVFYYWKLATIILLLGIIPALFMAQGIGEWYAVLYQRYFRFPQISFSLSRDAIIIGLIASLLPGWITSSMSLVQVFSLNPAEAMRPPSPAKFNRSFFERRHILNPHNIQTKMIIRNIISRPWRSFISILGIVAATGILINGGFWSDIIEFIIQKQFYETSREDLEIHFIHPRRQEVLSEIRRIPGVLLIEGSRSVAVKMSFRNYLKDTIVVSTEGIATLRRVVNRQGEVLKPRERQILLSDYFKRKFNLNVGDEVTLDVADKSQHPFSVTVGGFVDDVIGATIYANKEDLHRWLSEAESISTVFVKIDPAQAESIYIKLKQFPEVASVAVKRLLLESFTATLSDMILTFTMILIAFAITITGAVLFNLSRINLSEKAWELASMKIIGFDVHQVFHLLFIELGIQVCIALTPGLFLGYALSYLSTQWIHTDTFSFPLIIDTKTYALALVVIVLTYFVIGWFLFYKVRSLNMTEALKSRE